MDKNNARAYVRGVDLLLGPTSVGTPGTPALWEPTRPTESKPLVNGA